MDLKAILSELKKLGNPKVKKTKENFAISVKNSYGIFLKDLNVLAKKNW